MPNQFPKRVCGIGMSPLYVWPWVALPDVRLLKCWKAWGFGSAALSTPSDPKCNDSTKRSRDQIILYVAMWEHWCDLSKCFFFSLTEHVQRCILLWQDICLHQSSHKRRQRRRRLNSSAEYWVFKIMRFFVDKGNPDHRRCCTSLRSSRRLTWLPFYARVWSVCVWNDGDDDEDSKLVSWSRRDTAIAECFYTLLLGDQTTTFLIDLCIFTTRCFNAL